MPSTDRGRRKSPLNHDPESLRWAIAKAGLSQAALAKAVDRTPGFISEVCNGTRNAHPALLLAIARALNCPPVVLEAKREYGQAS